MQFNFDTLNLARILKKHDYSEQQADGFVEAVKEMKFDRIATQEFVREEIDKQTMKLTISMGVFTGFLAAIKFFG